MFEIQHCHHCLSANVVRKGLTGKNKTGKMRYLCKDCRRTFVRDGASWFVADRTKKLKTDRKVPIREGVLAWNMSHF